jgi:hypothetical protein
LPRAIDENGPVAKDRSRLSAKAGVLAAGRRKEQSSETGDVNIKIIYIARHLLRIFEK